MNRLRRLLLELGWVRDTVWSALQAPPLHLPSLWAMADARSAAELQLRRKWARWL